MKTLLFLLLFALTSGSSFNAAFQNPYGKLPPAPTPGDRMMASFLAAEASVISSNSLANIQTIEDWNRAKGPMRQELFEMLGLDPLPTEPTSRPR